MAQPIVTTGRLVDYKECYLVYEEVYCKLMQSPLDLIRLCLEDSIEDNYGIETK